MLKPTRSKRSGFILLDLAVAAVLLLLVFLIQFSIMHRNQVFKEEKASRKNMKWIARAEELYFNKNGQYTERFRELRPFVRDVHVFVCPTSGDLYRLWIDELGRYEVESPAGHGSILSGDPDWE